MAGYETSAVRINEFRAMQEENAATTENLIWANAEVERLREENRRLAKTVDHQNSIRRMMTGPNEW